MSDYLLLKWGSIKGWKVSDEKHLALLQKLHDLGVSMSAMAQQDTQEQKAIICELIDCFNGEITNDWSGEKYSKEEAKKYIMEYDK